MITPQVCFTCGVFIAQENDLCSNCTAGIQRVVSVQVALRNGSLIYVQALGNYEGPLKKLVLAKSYSSLYASLVLGKLMCEHMEIAMIDADIIVPVPLHWSRYAWRGFNQAHEIAKQISIFSGKPVVLLAKRKKRTIFQSLVDGKDRNENVKNVFELIDDAQRYAGKKIVIVDDLFTTGATIKELANTLVQIDPLKISALVAARAVAEKKK